MFIYELISCEFMHICDLTTGEFMHIYDIKGKGVLLLMILKNSPKSSRIVQIPKKSWLFISNVGTNSF